MPRVTLNVQSPMTFSCFEETRALSMAVSKTLFGNYNSEAKLGFINRFNKHKKRVKRQCPKYRTISGENKIA